MVDHRTPLATLTANVWADGFGIWHCKTSAHSLVPNEVHSTYASSMVQEQIDLRNEAGPGWKVRLELVGSGLLTNGHKCFEYKEASDEDED